MKLRYLLIGFFFISVTIFAAVGPPYDNSKPMPLSLPAAYQFAEAALGPAKEKFHCVAAYITTDFGGARWAFAFYSSDRPPRSKMLVVDMTGKVQEDNGTRS
jgi:hypothetical protein